MKKYLKHILAMVVILVAAAVFEIVIFGWKGLVAGYDDVVISLTNQGAYDVTYETIDSMVKLSDEEVNAIEVDLENKRLLAEYYGEAFEETYKEGIVKKEDGLYQEVKQTNIDIALTESMYIHKMKLSLPLEESCGYTLDLYQDGQMVADSMYCSINPKIDAGIINVCKEGDRLQIALLTEEEFVPDECLVTLSNRVAFNGLRYFYFVTTLMAVYFIIFMGKEATCLLREKPQWVFALFALLLGSLLIVGIGTNQVSYDEYVHAKSAYKLSFGTTIETTEAAMQMNGNNLPFFYTPEEKELVYAYLDKMNDPNVIAPDMGTQNRLPRTETRVYYPMAAGFFVGRHLGLGFATCVALAKLGNLLCYIAIMFFAVKFAKGYEMVVAGIGLLPNNIFTASALSYDGLVTSCLILGYVMLLNEFFNKTEKVKPLRTFVMLFAFLVGCLSKPVYIVMALMLLFLGWNKFENKPQAVVYKLAVLGLAGLMLYNIFFPTPVAGGDYQLVSNAAFAGDKRNVGTSTMGQIAFIMGNPLTYTKILLGEMWTMITDYTIHHVSFVGYAYLGTTSFFVNWVCILLGFFAALFANVKDSIGKVKGGLTHLMNFGVAAVVFTSMYISYTSVGSDQILGVQGRYFIPLFLPFLSTLMGWNKGKLGQKVAQGRDKLQAMPALYERVIFGVMILISLWMTMKLVVLTMNI